MSNPGRGHEVSEASTLGIAGFGLSLVVGAVLMHAVLAWWFFELKRQEEAKEPRDAAASLLSQRGLAPPPRLQVDPRADLQAYFKRQQELLSSYGWTDAPRKIARIPIDRAMDLFVERSRKKSAGSGRGRRP